MSVTKQTYGHHVQRIVLSSQRPFEAVISALNTELNKDNASPSISRVLARAKTRAELEQGVRALTEGKRDFVLFAAGSHSKWMNTYYAGERMFPQTVVFTIGNPLLAKDVLRHDMAAGLDLPPKLLVQETESGGTMILYNLPSSFLPAGDGQPNSEMKVALEDLDRKFEMLARKVLSDEGKL
ncbi:hypothetical protein BC835DRAFT_1413671 [Cytidiella melzeri]|nr:hypothetical protein BC835DRAFT_1413671 [Cytidiella melzeri]